MERFLQSYFLLAEQAMRRTSTYLRDVGDLTREGSVEPRLWVGCVETMWSGLADDFGDFLNALTPAGEDDTGEGSRAATIALRKVNVGEQGERQTVQELALDIPRWAFDPPRVTKLELEISGLWLDGACVMRPGAQLLLTPEVVTVDAPRSKLRLFDIPDGLLAGMNLSGSVQICATNEGRLNPPRPVLAVQVRIG